MSELIRVAVEENSTGIMIHLIDMPGAFTRGKNINDAMSKVPTEAKMYKNWIGNVHYQLDYEIYIAQKETTKAQLDDGDTEILIVGEINFDLHYFQQLKVLALKSAVDFQKLYDSIPDKEYNDISKNRTTFYGKVPSNAEEMLHHVDEVKTYYLSRIDISFSKEANDFVLNRSKAIELVESANQSYNNQLFYIDNEWWTAAKVLRRFIWHDRIHARALYRFSLKKWENDMIFNSFKFDTGLINNKDCFNR